MNKLLILLSIFLLVFANRGMSEEINIKSIPDRGYPDTQILIMEDGTQYFARNLIDIKYNGISTPNLLISKTNTYINLRIPDSEEYGVHKIEIFLDDNVHGELLFEVIKKQRVPGDSVNGYDPDPDTQNGVPIDPGPSPIGIDRGVVIINPPGGFGPQSIPCDSMHRVDGIFTDSVYNTIREWDRIVPLVGTFSNLYLDYCAKDTILYIMNDWKLGNGNYDSLTCYNLFEFMTANGREKWIVKVWNSVNKGIEVTRNGIDVSNDSNFVIGGRFGFAESPLVDSAHTMWEFGVKAHEGLYVMRLYRDEIGWLIIEPGVTTKCDENGIEGYNLVQAPEMVIGSLGNDGSRVSYEGRYIPICGVAGLVIEPSEYSGVISNNNLTIYTDGVDGKDNPCNDNHTIDGKFTENGSEFEWSNTKPAIGKYSNLYAEYCNNNLYILNDWVLATNEPDEKNCYNLFELYTGNGSEHWGIYVYHDLNRSIKVFRNGVDVSSDTNIVLGGAYGFSESALEDKPHTIYEFAIKAEEGAWHMFLADPGPSSFCDKNPEAAPREFNSKVGIRKFSDDNPGIPGDHYLVIQSEDDKEIDLAFGTYEETQEWFSRMFKVEIVYDPENFLPISVRPSVDNPIAPDLNVIMEITEPGKLVVEGKSEANFDSNGDLFILEGKPIFNSKSVTTISGSMFVGNRTTYMLKSSLPELTFDKITSNSNSIDEIGDLIISYPNPIHSNGGQLITCFSLTTTEDIKFELIDIKGNVTLLKGNKTYSAGENIEILNLPDLPHGNYFLRISGKNLNRVLKVEIIK